MLTKENLRQSEKSLEKMIDEYERLKKETLKGGWFVKVLTLLFITLKLCNVITWSWWFVLLPVIISFSFSIIFTTFCTILIMYTRNKINDFKLKNKEV